MDVDHPGVKSHEKETATFQVSVPILQVAAPSLIVRGEQLSPQRRLVQLFSINKETDFMKVYSSATVTGSRNHTLTKLTKHVPTNNPQSITPNQQVPLSYLTSAMFPER